MQNPKNGKKNTKIQTIPQQKQFPQLQPQHPSGRKQMKNNQQQVQTSAIAQNCSQNYRLTDKNSNMKAKSKLSYCQILTMQQKRYKRVKQLGQDEGKNQDYYQIQDQQQGEEYSLPIHACAGGSKSKSRVWARSGSNNEIVNHKGMLLQISVNSRTSHQQKTTIDTKKQLKKKILQNTLQQKNTIPTSTIYPSTKHRNNKVKMHHHRSNPCINNSNINNINTNDNINNCNKGAKNNLYNYCLQQKIDNKQQKREQEQVKQSIYRIQGKRQSNVNSIYQEIKSSDTDKDQYLTIKNNHKQDKLNHQNWIEKQNQVKKYDSINKKRQNIQSCPRDCQNQQKSNAVGKIHMQTRKKLSVYQLIEQDSIQYIKTQTPGPATYHPNPNPNHPTPHPQKSPKPRPTTSIITYLPTHTQSHPHLDPHLDPHPKYHYDNQLEHVSFGTSKTNPRSQVRKVQYCDWNRPHCYGGLDGGPGRRSEGLGDPCFRNLRDRFGDVRLGYNGPDYYTKDNAIDNSLNKSTQPNLPSYYFLSEIPKGIQFPQHESDQNLRDNADNIQNQSGRKTRNTQGNRKKRQNYRHKKLTTNPFQIFKNIAKMEIYCQFRDQKAKKYLKNNTIQSQQSIQIRKNSIKTNNPPTHPSPQPRHKSAHPKKRPTHNPSPSAPHSPRSPTHHPQQPRPQHQHQLSPTLRSHLKAIADTNLHQASVLAEKLHIHSKNRRSQIVNMWITPSFNVRFQAKTTLLRA